MVSIQIQEQEERLMGILPVSLSKRTRLSFPPSYKERFRRAAGDSASKSQRQ